jgi:hypothetical protein
MTSSEDRNALSDSEQLDKFMASVNQNETIAEVDPSELRRFHERLAEHAGHLKPGTAISIRVMAPGMSMTEAGPLWLRNVFLSFLLNQGLLATRHRSRRRGIPSRRDDSS